MIPTILIIGLFVFVIIFLDELNNHNMHELIDELIKKEGKHTINIPTGKDRAFKNYCSINDINYEYNYTDGVENTYLIWK